jgi:hypothetical protein
MFRRLLIATLIFMSAHARAADFVFDANVFYFTDDFTYDDTPNTYSRLMWDVTPAFTLTKKGRFVLGWNYASYTFTENPGTETSLTVTDMGPKFMYYLNKDKTWVFAFTYNLITKADYTAAGASATELRGSSMKGEFGYMPMMWERVYMGAKLNYYQASFNEEITGETALDQVSHSRTVIYPTFAMTIRWD